MMNDSIDTTGFQPDAAADELLFDSWFDPIEHAVRDRVRSFIEGLIEGELAAVLARPRYGRRAQDGDGAATSNDAIGTVLPCQLPLGLVRKLGSCCQWRARGIDLPQLSADRPSATRHQQGSP